MFDTVNLVLAGTPIGNIGDATPRLVQALTAAEVIACEDTRRTRDLCKRLELEIGARLLAYHEHNEAELTPQLLELATSGTRVLQVSDAGMPGISDPGFRLSQAAAAADIPYTILPGPSAPLLALVGSGLPTDAFTFVGFLPRKTMSLYQTLQSLVSRPETLIFLESPRRTLATLQALSEVFGPTRRAVVARELTKTHEEFLRGDLESVQAKLESRGEVLGEIVIVVAGASPEVSKNVANRVHLERMEQLIQNGVKPKSASKLVASWFNTSANILYSAFLEQKSD